MSVFYPKSKWHLLLSELRNILKRVDITRQAKRVLIFLNRNRGENIRLVIEFNSDNKENILRKISKSIRHFISANPANSSPPQNPVTSFFADFPTSEVYYNLFNERYLKYDAATIVQEHLSQILLDFFAMAHVNKQTISALIGHLNWSLLNELLHNLNGTGTVISCVHENLATNNFEKTQHENLLKENPMMVIPFEKFGKAAHKLIIENGHTKMAYEELMEIIQTQLGELLPRKVDRTLSI
jgi:hypothetical protein